MSTPLFREQAIAAQHSFNIGSVSLYQLPYSSFISLAALLLIGLLLIYLFIGGYTKKSTVTGYLFPEHGVSVMTAELDGVVSDIYVKEGDFVHEGQSLLLIKPQLASSDEKNVHVSISDSLLKQRQAIDKEKQAVIEQKILALHRSEKNLDGLRAERIKLEAEIVLAGEQVAVQEVLRQKYLQLSEQGYVSDLDLQRIKKELLTLNMSKAALERGAVTLERQIEDALQNMAASELQFEEKLVALDRQIASYEQEIIYQKSGSDRLLTAPRSGLVTNVLVYASQSVNAKQNLLTVMPEHSALQASLRVPSQAIGLVRENQLVKLRLAAFPYQKYGMFSGTVKSISKATVNDAANGEAQTTGFYLVTVAMLEQGVQVEELTYSLKSGMQLEADIFLERRTIIEWMLEPVLSLVKKV